MRAYLKIGYVRFCCKLLALLEQKPGALDQAAPLQTWTLPEPLQHLPRLLEARMGNRGKREFIRVLRSVANVKTTSAADYAVLVSGRAA